MFTDSQIRNAKPQAKPYKLPKEAGLFLIVNPNGKKWWRFSYRFGGKEKTISLGTYPLIPLALARERRDAARRLVAEKVDPSAQRREEREKQTAAEQNTFAAMVELWDADEMAAKSDDYRATVRRMLERDVLPYIGDRPLLDVKTRELVIVFDRIRQRGVEETARRARTNVGQVFRYAIRRGFAEHDPTQALKGDYLDILRQPSGVPADPTDRATGKVTKNSVTYTRYGDIWAGKGFNRALPNPLSKGGNISAGYMMCEGVPSRAKLNDFLSGWSGGAGYYDVVGASVSANSSGVAVNVGLGLGGGGYSPGVVNKYQGSSVLNPPP